MKKIIISSLIIIFTIAFAAPWLWVNNGENILESEFFRGNDTENFKIIKDNYECDGLCLDVKWFPFGVKVDACSEDYYFISFWGQRFYVGPKLNQQEEVSTNTDEKSINRTWNYSINIPEGYSVRTADNEGIVYIMAQTTPEGDTFADITIKSKMGTIESDIDAIEIISQEDIVVNGVKGLKTVALFYCSPKTPRSECTNYQLEDDGVVYEFDHWECLVSDIFDDVVQSFQLVE